VSSDSEVPAGAAERVDTVRVEDEMEQSYIDYAMSVIVGRALPDARDGLKPVQRRILYAMHGMGLSSGSGHRKSSSVVGETMGNYHPHGDDSIYDSLARMAQDFSLRYPLVDGQGNFGSVDGDPPAAMRYTESRMAPIAEELLEDIGEETVDFKPNYDDRLEEPAVLPSALPNLLLNGASGIAVGMSTNIPPHNLGEVVDAAIHLLDNPDCGVDDLMEHVRGPDFPTGATIVGREGIREAYHTGRGRLRVRADLEVDHEAGRIVVTALPYQENKARRIERIADDVNDGEIEGISAIRDESDRDGIRIVIELKRGANADVVKNQLLESHLERTFSVISLALVDGQPRVLDLRGLLEQFVEHRKAVVRRRSEYRLAEAEDRAHILEGRLRALEDVDRVVDLVRDAEDRDAAIASLVESFDLSVDQAEHVVRMQIGSLTSMEAAEVAEEYETVQGEIARLETILREESELRGVIESELRELKAEYDDDRRTRIAEDHGSVTREDLIAEAECVVVLTESDYVKRMPVETFDPQHRGGKGIIGARLKDGDRVSTVFQASTHDYLLCFTTHGQVYQLKTYELPEMGRTARGTSAVNVLDLDDGEEVTAVVNTDDFGDEEYLAMATRNGYVKRTPADEFENVLSTGIIAAKLEEGDELIDVAVTDGQTDLLLATRDGMTIRFDEAEVRPMGRSARGVNGVKLRDDDCRAPSVRGPDAVVGLVAIGPEDPRDLLTVTWHGYGKRTPLTEYRTQSRYGYGLVDIKANERNGHVADVKPVSDDDHLFIMSEGGQIMRTRAGEVSEYARNTQGVRVMNLEDDDWVASVAVFGPGSDSDNAPGDDRD